MLRILSIILAVVMFSFPAEARKKKEPVLEENKAYVIYAEGCPICKQALEYINDKYLTRPDIVKVNIATEEGQILLKQCAKKFNFKTIVVPVVCMGDTHFMGWSGKAAKDFDENLIKMHEH